MMNKAYGQSNKPACELVVGSPRKSCETFYQCRTILFWEVVKKLKRFWTHFHDLASKIRREDHSSKLDIVCRDCWALHVFLYLPRIRFYLTATN